MPRSISSATSSSSRPRRSTSSPAASTARSAARWRSPGDMRLVMPTKMGDVPTGSMITSSVTNVSPSTRQSTGAAD
jgi:hypothetical protein